MSNFYRSNKCFRHVSNTIPMVSFKRYLFNYGKRAYDRGYTLLFPDIPQDTEETNELLRIPTNDSTTQFSKLNAEKAVKATAKMSIEFESTIDGLENQFDEKLLSNNLNEVVKPIEDKLVGLDFCLANLRLLRNVDRSNYQFRNFDVFYNRMNSVRKRRFESQQIYYFMREINSNRDELNNQEKRVVDKYLLEAKLFGTHLTATDKLSLNEVQQKLMKQKSDFRSKLEEATKRFTHTVDDPALLQVLPDQLIASIGSHSNATVTLHSSVFNPFMEYCPDRNVRYNLWLAYNTRASPVIDRQLSNSITIEEIRSLRRSQAQLLGYDNYAQLSLETKMAHSLDNVKAFINTLHIKNKPSFDTSLDELTEFAKKSGSFEADRLELWDLPYWQRKLLLTRYSIEDSAVKQYFPLNAVIDGMFDLAESLFNIRIEEVDKSQFDPWHQDVRLFRIVSDKGLVASFYLDPYARADKSFGSLLERPLVRCDSLQSKPITYLVTSFPKPLLAGQSTQLSFTQVIGLFKQFGFILQNSMSEIDYSEISGLNNLEWDVTYFMSNFFSLWPLNSYKALASCSNHVVDGSQIPEAMFNNIKQAHYHFSAVDLKHEIYRMALDIALYTNTEFWAKIKDEVWDEYMTPFSRDKKDTHPCSFKAIFCDEYPAAYFSFKWAEMLAADAFGAFQEVGLENESALSEVGTRFRDTFLKLSGGYNSNEVFRRFLGRDPSVDAFLRINSLSSYHKKDIISGIEKTSEVKAEKHVN